MSAKDMILFFFPFTTTQVYETLAPFLLTSVVLFLLSATALFFASRYLLSRIGKALGKARRQRRKKNRKTVSVKKPQRYRSDDPRRITPKDLRIFILFCCTLAAFFSAVVGVTAAAGDIYQRDPVSGLYQIREVTALPGERKVLRATSLTAPSEIILYVDSQIDPLPNKHKHYRLYYYPRTRAVVQVVELPYEA